MVDDHAILREGLASLLEGEEDIAVVGQAGEGAEGLRLVGDLHPDVVILDIKLPGMSGIDICRTVKDRYPGVHVLILSMYEDEEYVRRALSAGAQGYLLKEIASSELVAAVRKAVKGERVLCGPVLERMVDDYGRGKVRGGSRHPLRDLSDRQMNILDLVSEGKRNREIAAELYISEKTVEKDISAIYRKLGVSTRTEAIALYHRIRGMNKSAV